MDVLAAASKAACLCENALSHVGRQSVHVTVLHMDRLEGVNTAVHKAASTVASVTLRTQNCIVAESHVVYRLHGLICSASPVHCPALGLQQLLQHEFSHAVCVSDCGLCKAAVLKW